MPIVIATSWYFNSILIEKYLVKKRYGRFSLYTIYAFIISLDIEMMLMFVAFTLLSYYDHENMPNIISSYKYMPLLMYFIVILWSFVAVVSRLIRQQEPNQPEKESYINIRANRQNNQVKLTDIFYIESMADYIRIILTSGEKLDSRMKISHFGNQLPDNFIRIHRSYIVNKTHIDSFTREYVTIAKQELPISRTYKKEALEHLK